MVEMWSGEGERENEVDGWMYNGQFLTGQRHGNGRCEWLENATWYDGDWQDGLQHGLGEAGTTMAAEAEYAGGLPPPVARFWRMERGENKESLSNSQVLAGAGTDLIYVLLEQSIAERKMAAFMANKEERRLTLMEQYRAETDDKKRQAIWGKIEKTGEVDPDRDDSIQVAVKQWGIHIGNPDAWMPGKWGALLLTWIDDDGPLHRWNEAQRRGDGKKDAKTFAQAEQEEADAKPKKDLQMVQDDPSKVDQSKRGPMHKFLQAQDSIKGKETPTILPNALIWKVNGVEGDVYKMADIICGTDLTRLALYIRNPPVVRYAGMKQNLWRRKGWFGQSGLEELGGGQYPRNSQIPTMLPLTPGAQTPSDHGYAIEDQPELEEALGALALLGPRQAALGYENPQEAGMDGPAAPALPPPEVPNERAGLLPPMMQMQASVVAVPFRGPPEPGLPALASAAQDNLSPSAALRPPQTILAQVRNLDPRAAKVASIPRTTAPLPVPPAPPIGNRPDGDLELWHFNVENARARMAQTHRRIPKAKKYVPLDERPKIDTPPSSSTSSARAANGPSSSSSGEPRPASGEAGDSPLRAAADADAGADITPQDLPAQNMGTLQEDADGSGSECSVGAGSVAAELDAMMTNAGATQPQGMTNAATTQPQGMEQAAGETGSAMAPLPPEPSLPGFEALLSPEIDDAASDRTPLPGAVENE